MALTPQDVVNKRFQHVKFREGYDQEEVDDFLDEVVLELRRLYQENDELRQKLSACEQRNQELSQGQGAAGTEQTGAQSIGSQPAAQQPAEDPQATQAMPAAVPEQDVNEAPAADEKKEQAASPLVAPQQSADAPREQADEKPQQTQQGAAANGYGSNAAAAGTGAAVGAVAGGAGGGDQDAHGLISLAQRLHDEHVAEGERTRDKLISEARTKADQIVKDAEKKRDDTLSTLESQKTSLEREIDGLQNFERQYRTRLKSYLTDQLRELENSGSLAPETLGGNQQPGHSI